MEIILNYLMAGWTSLLDYLAAHVLLCLVPAFVIAGFISTMIPKEAITRYLGPKTSKWISYPAAAVGGFILAVCSCTILPLFGGIWKRGAGLGPAVTFLFVGPAINILAITYTGAAIGFDVALARLVLSIAFGILIGLIMAWIFRREEAARAHSNADQALFAGSAAVKPAVWQLFGLLIAILFAGTLQVDVLTAPFASLDLGFLSGSGLMSLLASANLSVQGALLIVMLVFIAVTAWLGFEDIYSGFNRWTYAAIALIGLTILVASPVEAVDSLSIGITGRLIVEFFLVAALAWVSVKNFTRDEIAGWIGETWKFTKQIFPMLLVGVFAAGILKEVIPAAWVRAAAGQNTLLANAVGVVFGVFMYFPTLVEVPVAKMFLDLGMARGPLLAYLLADPELSLQSILVLGKIMGAKKTGVYVVLVALFATVAGYVFGLVTAAVGS